MNDQEEAALRRQVQEVEDLKWVMSTAAGRRFVARLLDRTAVWTMVASPEPTLMAFENGRRSVGLELFQDIGRFALDSTFQMQRECRSREGDAS